MTQQETKARREIFKKVSAYYKKFHQRPAFKPGESFVNYGGRVYDDKELINLTDTALDFWLTAGRYCAEFEKELGAYLGVKYVSLVNSGSSANLIAFMALTSPKLGARQIKPGDEVITVAAGFPTTVTPVIQYGAVPVFVDVALPSYNIDCSLLEKAVSRKTKAVMIAHTLGNPFDIDKVKKFCDKHGLWLIEDNCDALGSRYAGKFTGTHGDIGTSSFYPPHHMTMGEGGAVYTNDPLLKKLIESFRDWGRDCWCASGKDNTCHNRFTRQYGELPLGYDHKYVYSHFGYNLKATEMQAAIGLAQLKKFPAFVEARKKNWAYLRKALSPYAKQLILPEATPKADPSWFGFLVTVHENAGFKRDALVAHLENNKVQTRMLFAGNLIKHPCFDAMRKSGKDYRVAGKLENTDRILNSTFWVGVYPGMKPEMLKYMAKTFTDFLKVNK
ncbi:MAG: lipopolysaccharide biosynthesis protein RfbH [Elusimicrobia bacterium GWB2_63_22]|nr:MAG: lipopolysaccharide biosynthesis protein RfbH [Elusimicrobia bacterium GWB2_63_22]